MFRARSPRFTRLATGLAAIAMTLLVATTSAFGQTSGTATLRGTVEDSSGGILPGATVTLTSASTKSVQTAVTTDRGGYTFSGVFPGVYDLKVEMSGFKTYEQKAIAISPQDTRGIDVRLDVGQQTETVTVTATNEVIQTETGAREGVLTRRADRQPVGRRPQLARTAAHPARRRRRPTTPRSRRVSFGGGANNTQGLHGQRHPSVGQQRQPRWLAPDRHRRTTAASS